MKRSIACTLFFVALLFLTTVAVAQDKEEIDGYTCSPAKVAGTWGYSETGTVYYNGVATPYASLGRYALDADGNLLGVRTAALGSIPQPLIAYIKGKATVNPDCRGTETLNFYSDPDYKNLTSTVTKALVYVDQAREVRKIIIPGATLQAVLITEGKKLSPGHGDDNER